MRPVVCTKHPKNKMPVPYPNQQRIPDLSVVVPFFNEEDSIGPMYEALEAALGTADLDYELIFVDDGSEDRTFEIGASLARANHNLRMIKLRCNAGQTPAMMAGIDQARGAIIVTMDGDLQNDPLDIPLFVQTIREGSDIVVGWRHKRQDKLITRKIPSKVANWMIGKITGVPIRDNGCSLKAYRRPVIQSVPLYSEMHRFIPAMLSVTGARLTELKVRHHARRYGESKYGLSRIFRVLSDLITVKTLITSVSHPLLWFGRIAAPHLLISIICIIAGLMLNSASPTIFFGVAMVTGFSGLFLIACGVLCELVYSTGSLRIEQFTKLQTQACVSDD